MGSLMAGWDSPVLADDNKVRARRNQSLTKEEVEAFWKQHGSSSTNKLPENGEVTGSPGAMARSLQASSSSLARAVRIDPAALVFPDDDAGESPSKSRDWWTRSSWAFLNEPPQEEASGKAQSYAPQFHVARIATGNT